ncbi:S9 family peptidase [Shewanella sp. Scap07]|uniref:alpha/beta hydrolase family protein n=1 Tax=Shewanella sp. Scap07 TaxID=2589987 RepID=UPI0015C1A06A|nr:prolyl oligopeptidase family serine peptidase [Shewanella sp. Scap07]QLE84553.1 S9 family peptidase [Shewanella sp. Scap07]
MQFIFTLFTALIWFCSAQVMSGEYQHPSPAIEQVLNQSKSVTTRLSADNQYMVVLKPISQVDIKQLAQPELKLAGLRINPTSLAPSRSKYQYNALEIIKLADQSRHIIKAAQGLSYHAIKFSPDSQYLSYIVSNQQAAYIELFDLQKKTSFRLTNQRLNATLGFNYRWQYDSQAIITNLAISTKTHENSPTVLSPNISATNGKKAPRRTYQDLIKNHQDEITFANITTAQLSKIALNGQITAIGKPGINISYQVSPSNQYILVKQIDRPFSRIVKYQDFAQTVSLFDHLGHQVIAFGQLESGEFRPSGSDSVRRGPRLIHWRKDQPHTIAFVTPLDNGDGNSQPQYRDEISTLSAPFTGQAQPLVKTPWRISKLAWGEDNTLFITEKNSKQKQLRVSFYQDNHSAKPTLWYQKSQRDTYNDPGKLLYNRQIAAPLVNIESGHFVHAGLGASPQGYRPFAKQTNMADLSSSIIWQSQPNKLEKLIHLISRSPLTMVISREDSATAKQYWLVKGEKQTLLYQTQNALSQYDGVSRQLVHYQRQDGTPLSGMLYLPKGYHPSQGRLPVLMWAYPREYKDAQVASQVNFSKHQYQKISAKGPVAMVAHGFAVFDKVAMPIIGEGKKRPNDSFRQQLVSNAQAAIDVLVDMGVADPERVAIGGHSYGAFMVANLLAHSDLFSAGIARSGAYNRSLTPFGFQYEKRNYWEAPDLYQQMSPFTHADKIDEPLLLIHGEMDANSGTYPMQSERLFKAIRGLGGTARLVTLPYESHSYVARQSLAHMWWEQENWLLRYLGKADSHSVQTSSQYQSLVR